MPVDLRKLAEQGPIVTDGAWGTELFKRGLVPGDLAEIWNLEKPDSVREVARSYAEAGAAVVLTNTFRGNLIALSKARLQDKMAKINEAGVRLSREGVAEAASSALVFGSIGPSGEVLMLMEGGEEELFELFFSQAKALESGGADALVIETVSQIEELDLAVRAAKQATRLPVIACMSYDTGPDSDRTSFGVTVEQHVEAAVAAGADAVGGNCGCGAPGYVRVVRRLCELTDLPVWIKPNAGIPHLEGDVAVYDVGPDEFAKQAADLCSAGADFVGGCCGSAPEHIAALAKNLLPRQSRPK